MTYVFHEPHPEFPDGTGRCEICVLADKLQAQGPDEFPHGYYMHLAEKMWEEEHK